MINNLINYFKEINDDNEFKKLPRHFHYQTENFLNKQILSAYLFLIKRVGLDFRNKTVVDLGCKFGHLSILFRKLGVKTYFGIDANYEYIKIANKVFGNKKSFFLFSDSGLIDVKTKSIDFVIANEVISHIHPNYLTQYYLEIERILKKSGIFLISDGNNWLNKNYIQKLKNLYINCEKENQHNTKNTSYEKLRFQIIKKRFSSISDKKAQYLAENTSGLVENQIYNEVQKFLSKKEFTERKFRNYIFPVNPTNIGFAMERPFIPEQVKLELETYNFESKIIDLNLDRFVLRRINSFKSFKNYIHTFFLMLIVKLKIYKIEENPGFIVISKKK